MKFSIYLAGGYVGRDFARDVAGRLQSAEITFPWWDADQTDARAIAKREAQALDDASFLFVLDRDAGTGTSWEFGYWCGVMSRTPGSIDRKPVRIVADDAPRKLDWFGDVFARTAVCKWDAVDVAACIDMYLEARLPR
jgi:hypothetical protein